MRVLLIGATGNVGSRLLPALLAHDHKVIAFVRTPSNLSSDAAARVLATITGSALDVSAIKDAISTYKCDAVVNAAGFPAMTRWGPQGEQSAIFQSVMKACVEVSKERGGPPVRCWMMSSFFILNSPTPPFSILDYIPLFPAHEPNYLFIQSHSTEELAWSLFCSNRMLPRHEMPQYPSTVETGSASNLVAHSDTPPAWSDMYQSIPFIGYWLNVVLQARSYYVKYEDCVDFIAEDLEKGLSSEWIGKRVGVKEKNKAE